MSTVVAGKIVSDDEDVARRIVRFDVSEQGNIIRRVARGGASSQFLAITHAQRSIDPGFFGATTVIQRRFDAMPIGRPGRRWREGAGNYGPELIGADGRRPLGRLRVVADDRRPFGTNSGSELLPQLWV